MYRKHIKGKFLNTASYKVSRRKKVLRKYKKEKKQKKYMKRNTTVNEEI